MYLDKEQHENNSKAIILLHAFTGTPTDVISVGRGLAREGYTVFLPTLDGHGLEDPDAILEYGIEDWTKNGQAAYDTLVKDGYTDISFFGLSLGGVIATQVMLNNDLESYGVFSSPVIPRFASNVPENFWVWYKFKKKKMGLSEEEINDRKDEVMTKLDGILKGINDHLLTLVEKYKEVEIPVFIGQGGKDEMINADSAQEFEKELVNADVELHWYEDAPHVITTGRAGKETQKDLLAFLEKHV